MSLSKPLHGTIKRFPVKQLQRATIIFPTRDFILFLWFCRFQFLDSNNPGIRGNYLWRQVILAGCLIQREAFEDERNKPICEAL